MIKNVKTNSDLVIEITEASLQAKQKWILISKDW